MANLIETGTYETGVYQIEQTDFVSGGLDGVSNTPTRQLANRTKWLKTKIDSFLAGTGLTKAMVGLGDVDNTTDLAKPVSTATQTALNAKAPLASPVFTGQAIFDVGSNVNPSIAFANDDAHDTGFYHINDGSFGVTCNAIPVATFSANQINLLRETITLTPNEDDNSNKIATTEFVKGTRSVVWNGYSRNTLNAPFLVEGQTYLLEFYIYHDTVDRLFTLPFKYSNSYEGRTASVNFAGYTFSFSISNGRVITREISQSGSGSQYVYITGISKL